MATDKKISIGSNDFSANDDGKILANPNPNVVSSISPVLLDLPWDVMEFGVRSGMVGPRYFQEIYDLFLTTQDDELLYINDGDLRNEEHGEPVLSYAGNTLRTKMYLQGIKARPNEAFDVTAYSAMGILEQQVFMGNFYKSQTVAAIIADIIGDAFTYSIDANVANTVITAPIGPMSRRRALSAVLLATGASLMKDANGDIVIAYNQQSEASTLAPIEIGGQQLDYERYTTIIVTEHSFYESANASEEVLFDNTNDINVTNYTITFDEPIQSFRADGITLDASGPFFATLSGVGVLYGVKYVHVTRDITETTGVAGAQKELRVSDCTMISPANSKVVLDRIVNYEANVQLTQLNALVTNEAAGDLVQFNDPYDGASTGYIIEMNRTISGQDKATLTIAKNWTPGYFGNAYDSYLIVTEDDLVNGVWNVPPELQGQEGLVVLFSGAEGGQGGYAGRTPGTAGGSGAIYLLYNDYGDPAEIERIGNGQPQNGGAGGAGGSGGAAATHIININVDSFGASYPVTFGAGGAGGAGGTVSWDQNWRPVYTDPAAGSPGDDSTFDGTSTADGATFKGTYLNLVTGEIIATDGDIGTAGGAGGNGGPSLQLRFIGERSTDAAVANWSYAAEGRGGDGEAVGSNTGGSAANGTGSLRSINANYYYVSKTGWYAVANAGGGGGGGAAAGANGSAGTAGQPGSITINHRTGGQITEVETFYFVNQHSVDDEEELDRYYGGIGGDGANAVTIPAQAALYHGGTGGAGGGGGGGAGASLGSNFSYSGSRDTWWGESRSGKGGNGAQGGQGSNGFMIVYWRASA